MKPHILYIHQFFKTPEEGGITRSYDIAKELLRYNYDITILTTWNRSTFELKTIDSIKVIYLPIAYKNEFNFKQRLAAFYNFQKEAIKFGKTLSKPDIIYATSTPLNVGYIGKCLARHYKVPWVFEVRDLWPEAPIQIGAIKNIFLKKALYFFEKSLYRNANKIVALSPAIKTYIKQKSKRESVLIPNLCNNDRFGFESVQTEDKFIIGYFGAISIANDVNRLVDIAEHLSKEGNALFEFRIFGEGLNDVDSVASAFRNLGGLENLKLSSEKQAILITSNTQDTGEVQNLYSLYQYSDVTEVYHLTQLVGNYLDIDNWSVENFLI